jgi:hypothetical protein
MNTPSRLRLLLAASLCAASAPALGAQSGRGFSAELQPASDAEIRAGAESFLRDRDVLGALAGVVNQVAPVPVSVALAAEECGEESTTYRRDVRRVVVCYELVHAIADAFRDEGLAEGEHADAVAGVATFVAAHQVAHALVHLLALPVYDDEEKAADQLTALLVSRRSPEAALWAARYFAAGDLGEGGTLARGTAFAGAHALDPRRLRDVLCWTWGADPESRPALLAALPPSTTDRCGREFRQLKWEWEDRISQRIRRPMTVSVGPGDRARPRPSTEPSALPEPSVEPLEGAEAWSSRETMAVVTGGLECENSGTYWFALASTPAAGRSRQTGTCIVRGKPMENNGGGDMTDVRLDGDRLTFTIGNCEYEGTVSFTAGRMEGTVSCFIMSGQTRFDVRGTWEATRG